MKRITEWKKAEKLIISWALGSSKEVILDLQCEDKNYVVRLVACEQTFCVYKLMDTPDGFVNAACFYKDKNGEVWQWSLDVASAGASSLGWMRRDIECGTL